MIRLEELVASCPLPSDQRSDMISGAVIGGRSLRAASQPIPIIGSEVIQKDRDEKTQNQCTVTAKLVGGASVVVT